MKILCKNNEGYQFSRRVVNNGNDRKTKYNGVQVKNTYTVYGMILYEGDIFYLLYDEFKMANWYPADLFEVIEENIPRGWYYKFYGYNDLGLTAIWGYSELVYNIKHYNGLAEQESNDYELFLKRKEEIDKQVQEGE